MPAPDRKRRLTTFVVAMAVLIATPLAVVAADAFNDVPDSNVHHEDITWLKDAGVTLGCNPPDNTEFCPGDPVLRQQMASFMRRLAENQVVDAATAQTADVAGTAYQAVQDGNAPLTGATSLDTAISVATLADLPEGTYVVTATWGASRGAGTNESRVVCHLTGGSEDARSILTVGGNPGFTLQGQMSSTMTTELGADDNVNLSCHAEALDGAAPRIIDTRLVAYPTNGVVSNSVTE